MLKWYKEFKLLQVNSFEKDFNKKISRLENKLLNLVEVVNARARYNVSNCKNSSIR